MKKFLKNVPGQIAGTFAIMVVCFTIISLSRGVETIPIRRLAELLLLAVIGGILMEFAFGTCIFKQMTDVKRVCIFIVPFSIITFICSIAFCWITKLDVISTYIKFVGIFIGCGVISIVLFEIEHLIRGKKYTAKLKEYQNGGRKNV
ncbi:MAG: hypothetical protein HDT39_11710 [Lachnospiraceae bacterium]|nr:hypothetical protein [Lachnospiraceae bacterium]